MGWKKAEMFKSFRPRAGILMGEGCEAYNEVEGEKECIYYIFEQMCKIFLKKSRMYMKGEGI